MECRIAPLDKQTTLSSTGIKRKTESHWGYHLRTRLFPLLAIIGLRIFVYHLSAFGTEDVMTWSEILFGNWVSWILTFTVIMWAVIFLKIPSKRVYGPINQVGVSLSYPDNGLLYYFSTSIVFLVTCYVYRSFPQVIYFNFPHLVASLNVVAYTLCLGVWIKGKYFPEHQDVLEEAPFILEFFLGIELNMKIFGVDIKQLVNNRVGMMLWQLLLFSYWIVSYQKFGFNWGMAVSVVLQTQYIFRFFYYEHFYFNSLDACLDRAGFYEIWGCLVFIPSVCVFTNRYFVSYPPVISKSTALILYSLGLICCFIIALIDLEKDIFRSSDGKRCLWNDRPSYIEAVYETKAGKHETKILTSGFWGVARHLNYAFDFFNYCVWSFPGYNFGIYPFLYCITLFFLLMHRTFRDDEKCLNKYGAAWQKYCKLVPYKIIPYVY